MKSLIIVACLKSLSVQSGRHTFVDDIGKAVVGYWTGARLSTGLPPLIPAIGAIRNISTVYAFCTSPGTWSPFGPTDPTDDSETFLDILISSMQIHLTTLQFIYFTQSIYPGPIIGPAPGILPAISYFIPPCPAASILHFSN